MHGVHELGAVERVGGGEHAAREQAELHEARDGLVLGGLGGARREPRRALAPQPRAHARHVLLLPPPLLLPNQRLYTTRYYCGTLASTTTRRPSTDELIDRVKTSNDR